MEWIRFGISSLCMITGLFFFCVGVFGTFKFKFILNRMHSAALLDTLGLLFVVVSVVVARGFDSLSVKYFLIILFLWLTSPISSHLISKMEVMTDSNLNEEITENVNKMKGKNDSDPSDI